MAECKDCLHNKVCSEVDGLKCRKDFIWYDAKSGCPYYAADVVPKSEVEKIFEEIEKLHLHITNEFDLRRYNELKKKYTEPKECPNCRYFLGCECFSGMTCDLYEEKKNEA